MGKQSFPLNISLSPRVSPPSLGDIYIITYFISNITIFLFYSTTIIDS